MTAGSEWDTLTVDLSILLPNVPDTQDDCVQRLTGSLQDREGIDRVYALEATNGTAARLCIHYDPEVTSLTRIRQVAKSLGTELTDQYGHLVRSVDGIRHPRHARTLTVRLRRTDGVLEAEVTAAGRVRVEYDRAETDENAIRQRLRRMGVRIREDRLEERDGADAAISTDARSDRASEEVRTTKEEHTLSAFFGERTDLILAILAGICVASGFGLSFVGGVPAWASLGLYLGAYLFGGFYTAKEALDAIRVGRFEVDTLMLVAALGAAVLGKWVEGAFLLFLFSLGHALEHYAMERARRAIESLADLAPETARVRRDGTEREVPVEEIEHGDTVIVHPNERIPADGFVVEGESEVNQAPVTGESVPVEKRPVGDPDRAAAREVDLDPAHRVFAGTINGSGALEMRVTKCSDETTLARAVQMVTEAETEKSPTQHFTDRFERYFVPAVLGLVVLLLFAWIPLDEAFAASFYRAMAVLVAASPCALAIATPSAVLSGVARAGRGGLLVKGGGPLENLGTLTALAFDKTGTLTEGEPRVTDVRPHDGMAEEKLLRTAVAVEQRSDHPLAEAVVRFVHARLGGQEIEDGEDVEILAGRGVRGLIDGEPVHVGNGALFDEGEGPPLPDAVRETVDELETNGRTTMIVRRGDRYLGVLGLMDTPRDGVGEVLERLRQLGIQRMVMISGDSQRVAEAVGRALGIDEARGDLLPDDKVDTIQALRKEEKVAMVGDGVNDAPAMANATVGIAMGAAGSDVALETADVALMADRLDHLPFAVGLSRQTRRIIKQNLWIALGMVAVLVPATIFGLQIGPAVVLHEGSTLAVVANALRLLGYSPS